MLLGFECGSQEAACTEARGRLVEVRTRLCANNSSPAKEKLKLGLLLIYT